MACVRGLDCARELQARSPIDIEFNILGQGTVPLSLLPSLFDGWTYKNVLKDIEKTLELI